MNAQIEAHYGPTVPRRQGGDGRRRRPRYGASGARFTTPKLDLDRLVWLRTQPGPAFDMPLAEIMDILVATGQWLTADPKGWVSEALDLPSRSSPLPRDVLETSYAGLGAHVRRPAQHGIPGAAGTRRRGRGGWLARGGHTLATARVGVRAFPPRLVHIIAGNAPGVAAQTVIRGALTKGVHLIKIPSNDLFTATAILRAMSAVAPGHPLAQSFSAVYWRGGDVQVEGRLFRAQYFDKLVAWGGESTIRTAQKYIGPGFELVSFDPKTSISMIGREAFVRGNWRTPRRAADATVMNQQACVSSRVQFIEGVEQIDRFCAGCRNAWASSVRRPRHRDDRFRSICARRSTACGIWSRSTASGAAMKARDS